MTGRNRPAGTCTHVACPQHPHPAGTSTAASPSKEDQLLALAEGTLSAVVGGDTIELEPGDELFCPAGVLLALAAGTAPARLYRGFG